MKMNRINELPVIKGYGRKNTNSLRLCVLMAIWNITACLSARLRRKHNLSKGAMPDDMSLFLEQKEMILAPEQEMYETTRNWFISARKRYYKRQNRMKRLYDYSYEEWVNNGRKFYI